MMREKRPVEGREEDGRTGLGSIIRRMWSDCMVKSG